jgi:hypothetical protein
VICRQARNPERAGYALLDSADISASVAGYRSTAAGARPKLVERASHASSALVHYVGTNHRRADIAMAEQFLDRPDVVTAFQ